MPFSGYVPEKDQPSNLIQVAETSLVARQPGQGPRRPAAQSDTCVWQGKVVKNFKKFQKVCGGKKIKFVTKLILIMRSVCDTKLIFIIKIIKIIILKIKGYITRS